MIKITKNIGIGIVIFALVLSFLSGMLTAKAKADLNTMIANVAGTIMGNGWVDSNVEDVSEDIVGSAGDTQSTMRIAQIELDVSSGTAASLYNGSSRDRFVTKATLVLRGEQLGGTYVSPASDGYDPVISTSSDEYYNNGKKGGTMFEWSNISTGSPSIISATTTDTTRNSAVTTTPIWNTLSYLNLNFATTIASSSEGILIIEYFVLP